MKTQDACVADIIAIIEKLAPLDLAETWDNVGLQVGSYQSPVKKIWVALDPLMSVVAAAVSSNVDMVITHHPLIFQPLTHIDLDSALGQVVHTAIRGSLSLYAAHTNLDSALDGVNDTLMERMGLSALQPLVPVTQSYELALSDHMTFSPGLGRVGVLPKPMSVDALARQIKARLGISQIRTVGDPKMKVHSAAVCSGSGAGLMEAFLASEAQVYISGDLKYHDARTAEAHGRAMIDIGHFASEHIFIDALVEKLTADIKETGWCVNVEACRLEKDPFNPL